MTANTVVITLCRPEPIDGLCQTCWSPALVTIPAGQITDTGVRGFNITLCLDCRARVAN